jgi:L,D-peptidoglycan transpeptidase YkuD (ErfK/YbiS/YcfS/YnhG family)
MRIYLKNKHTLQVDDFKFKCCIGKNGLSYKKIEGDKKTPIGIFEIWVGVMILKIQKNIIN